MPSPRVADDGAAAARGRSTAARRTRALLAAPSLARPPRAGARRVDGAAKAIISRDRARVDECGRRERRRRMATARRWGKRVYANHSRSRRASTHGIARARRRSERCAREASSRRARAAADARARRGDADKRDAVRGVCPF